MIVRAPKSKPGPESGPFKKVLRGSQRVSRVRKPRKTRYFQCFTRQRVPPLGLEPRTHGLRVRCSTN